MHELRERLRIRRFRREDAPALLALYRRAFGAHGGGDGRGALFGNTVVAELDGAPVGFGCWEAARERRSAPALADLLACLEPTTRRILDAPGLELPLRILAPAGVHPTLRPGDRVFTALAVRPDLRRQGIGTALALARLRIAARDQVDQVFLHAVTGSGSRPLYEGLGFVALVEKDHHYRDGTGMTLLYHALRV